MHQNLMMSRSSTNLVSVQVDLKRYWQETTAYKYVVYLLPKQKDEKGTICTFLHSFRSSPSVLGLKQIMQASGL